jgi:hypothetical protein
MRITWIRLVDPVQKLFRDDGIASTISRYVYYLCGVKDRMDLAREGEFGDVYLVGRLAVFYRQPTSQCLFLSSQRSCLEREQIFPQSPAVQTGNRIVLGDQLCRRNAEPNVSRIIHRR